MQVFVNGKEKYYTSVLNFFEFNCNFEQLPTENIPFACKICLIQLKARPNRSSNLAKHLQNHPKTKTWFEQYRRNDKVTATNLLDPKMINLVSYFISSNTGLVELQNADFRAIVAPQVKIPSYYVFRKKILPEIRISVQFS